VHMDVGVVPVGAERLVGRAPAPPAITGAVAPVVHVVVDVDVVDVVRDVVDIIRHVGGGLGPGAGHYGPLWPFGPFGANRPIGPGRSRGQRRKPPRDGFPRPVAEVRAVGASGTIPQPRASRLDNPRLRGCDGLTGIDSRIHRLGSDRPSRGGTGSTDRAWFTRPSGTIRAVGSIRPTGTVSQPGPLRLSRLGDARLGGGHGKGGCDGLTGIDSWIHRLGSDRPSRGGTGGSNGPWFTRPSGTVSQPRPISEPGPLGLSWLGNARLCGGHRNGGGDRLSRIDSRIHGLGRDRSTRSGSGGSNRSRFTRPSGTIRAVGSIRSPGTVSQPRPLGESRLGNPRLGGNNTRIHRVDGLPRCGSVQATQVSRSRAISRETSHRTAQPGLTSRS